MTPSAVLPSSAAPETAHDGWCLRLMPSLADLAFLFPVILLFFGLPGLKFLLNDGDTGWHIRTGEWILQHRAVPRVDLFSFTKSGTPWYAWEWGWDVCFAWIHHRSGLTGVAAANLVLLCFVSALLYTLIRRASRNEILAFACTVIAMLGSVIHWLARPHLLSWVFILVFLHLVSRADQGQHRLLWSLPPLTLIWANFHGSFFAGVVIVLTSGLGAAMSLLKTNRVSWRSMLRTIRPYLLCAVACLAASFANPYTWHLHQHILRYLTDSKLLDEIVEYQSVSFHLSSAVFFEVMLLLGAGAAFWCVRIGQFAGFLGVLLWAHLALVSGRNIPLFLFVASPWIALMLQDLLSRSRSISNLRSSIHLLSEITTEFASFERIGRLHLLSVLTVFLLGWTFMSGKYRPQIEFDPVTFPAKALPLIEARGGRVFTSEQWGDYLIYRLYPSTRVFIDGRSDLYGTDLLAEYGHIFTGSYNCEQKLQRFAIDTVLVRPSTALATVLKKSSRWEVLFDDGSVIVFGAHRNMPVAKPPSRPLLNSFPRSDQREKELEGVKVPAAPYIASQQSLEERRRT